MTAVVVLGMHRTGTSLVANLLHNVLGVHMGDGFLGPGKGNPPGVWEDIDFFNLNRKILCRAADGHGRYWHRPPSREEILATEPHVRATIMELVHQKQAKRELWGWKDPRNCLTIELYHEHLKDPLYIVTKRSRSGTVASLERRTIRKRGTIYWMLLVRRCQDDRRNFLRATKAQHITLRFEKLVSESEHRNEVHRLADFIGVKADLDAVRKIIRFRHEKDPGLIHELDALPNLDQLDWTAIKRDLHNALFDRGLVTWQDVQRSQNGVTSAILAAVRRKLIALYRAKGDRH